MNYKLITSIIIGIISSHLCAQSSELYTLSSTLTALTLTSPLSLKSTQDEDAPSLSTDLLLETIAIALHMKQVNNFDTLPADPLVNITRFITADFLTYSPIGNIEEAVQHIMLIASLVDYLKNSAFSLDETLSILLINGLPSLREYMGLIRALDYVGFKSVTLLILGSQIDNKIAAQLRTTIIEKKLEHHLKIIAAIRQYNFMEPLIADGHKIDLCLFNNSKIPITKTQLTEKTANNVITCTSIDNKTQLQIIFPTKHTSAPERMLIDYTPSASSIKDWLTYFSFIDTPYDFTDEHFICEKGTTFLIDLIYLLQSIAKQAHVPVFVYNIFGIHSATLTTIDYENVWYSLFSLFFNTSNFITYQWDPKTETYAQSNYTRLTND